MIWHTEKATTDIAMTTNWVSAGVAASCKEKSARFLERNAQKSPKIYSTRFLWSFAFNLMKELIGYQLVAQFISASVSIFFFFLR